MPLDSAQQATFKADIEANTDPAVIQARSIGDNNAIAAWYNLLTSPAYYCWRTSMTVTEQRALFDWAEVVALNTNDLLALLLLSNGTIVPENDSIRGAFNSIFGAGTTRDNLLNAAKEQATNFQKLFADETGGNGSLATPAKYVLSDSVSSIDVRDALASGSP